MSIKIYVIASIELTPELAAQNDAILKQMKTTSLSAEKLYLNETEYLVTTHWLANWLNFKKYRKQFEEEFIPAVSDPNCLGVISCFCRSIPSQAVQKKNFVKIYNDYAGMMKVFVRNNTLHIAVEADRIDKWVLTVRKENFPYQLNSAAALRAVLKVLPTLKYPDHAMFFDCTGSIYRV